MIAVSEEGQRNRAPHQEKALNVRACWQGAQPDHHTMRQVGESITLLVHTMSLDCRCAITNAPVALLYICCLMLQSPLGPCDSKARVQALHPLEHDDAPQPYRSDATS